MIWNGFQKEEDDSVFTIVRNVSGSSKAAGQPVVWDISASVDGVRVTVPVTATLSLFRGILVETLADSAYGRCQIHGYNSVAAVYNQYTTTIAAGDILIPSAASLAGLIWSSVGDGKSGFVYAAEALAPVTQTTLSAAAAKKVLVRAI